MPHSHTELLPARTLPAARHFLDSRRPLRDRHVAVVGASGYVGSAVLEHLTTLGVPCTAVVRRPGALTPTTARVACADLDDPTSLRRALGRADTVIHAASYIGPDPTLCDRTNRVGTERVIDAADAVGVRNILYISTIGVYGLGPHTRAGESDLIPAPVTAASTTKLAAEKVIRQYGGTVLRPSFVYGGTNSPFLFGLADITTRLGSWVDNGAARASVISIGDLATAIVAVALRNEPPSGEIFHAGHPDPVTIRELVSLLARHGLTTVPENSLSFNDAIALAGERGLPPRLVDLVGHDHWYDPTPLWSLTGLNPTRLHRTPTM
ncbi:hypothetical protein B2J88_52085 [Rhodococcus sp. SRB_17]|nr:hypothetical protein [Rhodococcus sp. SRB_17]NMM92203.1 hypothetical protein [Rhodococcus sp. SRB_17]NMM92670.1 hypothetical protein [Rhodococcus sp. SRB_17]